MSHSHSFPKINGCSQGLSWSLLFSIHIYHESRHINGDGTGLPPTRGISGLGRIARWSAGVVAITVVMTTLEEGAPRETPTPHVLCHLSEGHWRAFPDPDGVFLTVFGTSCFPHTSWFRHHSQNYFQHSLLCLQSSRWCGQERRSGPGGVSAEFSAQPNWDWLTECLL